MDIEVDNTATVDESDYEISDNFLEDLVAFSRAKQIGNEPQALTVLLVYGTGLLPDWHDYIGGLISGGSSSGKSHMKREVIDSVFDYVNDWLYQTSGGSNKAAVDDEEIDEARIGAFDELQKIPDEMLEFLKSVTEDGGFTYGRNVADSDRESGRKTVKIERDPLPIVFMLADENEMSVEQELKTRLVEVKVDENETKNEGVHYMHHGHRGIKMDAEQDATYIDDRPELEHAVKSHVRDIPLDTPVVLPTGSGRFSGDDWDEAAVSAPLLSFKRSESTRASRAIASLVKSSALYNYHSRDTVDIDGETHIVAEPQDLGNVIALRKVLLAMTHGLTTKKFTIIDAIMENGTPVAGSDTAMQAEKDQIIEYIQNTADIATMSKSEVGNLLNELDEELILNKIDHPDDARKNMYVYDGAAAFQKPNIYEHYDHFEDVIDPIWNRPIEDTIELHLDQLNAKMDTSVSSIGTDSMSAADAMGGSDGSLSDFGDTSDADDTDLSDDAQRVFNVLKQTLGDTAACDASVEIAHMVGVTPIDTSGDVITAVRQPSGADKVDGFMSPDEWEDVDSFDAVEQRIVEAITELKQSGRLVITQDGDVSQVNLS